MKNLIIVFNRLDNHPNFNSNEIPIPACGSFMYETDNKYDVIKGFSEELNHFLRITPNKSIIESSFSDPSGFIEDSTQSEILLIHVKNNVAEWSNSFKNAYFEYASKFDKIFISYHKDDMDKGKHKENEDLIKKTPLKSIENQHHAYEFEKDNIEQLYGFLAKSIVAAKGIFSNNEYDKTIEKLIGFFPPDEEILQSNLLNQKIRFLHKLLGDELNEKKIEENLKEFNCNISFNRADKNASIIAIRNAILKS